MSRRGYDTAAVDAHLSALAGEVEEVKRGARPSQGETLATTVSEQVRGIIQAAESSAAEILRGAELEAQEIHAEASEAVEQASGEVQRHREHAAAQARLYVERLSNSISQLLGRLEAIDGELSTLTASLRSDTERLRGELGSLEVELEGAIAGTGVAGPGLQVEAVEAVAAVGLSEPAPVAADVSEPVSPPFVPDPSAEGAKVGDKPAPVFESSASEETESARLIALNMALNGTPREETERYLAENYDLSDRERLLDEVYASVQG